MKNEESVALSLASAEGEENGVRNQYQKRKQKSRKRRLIANIRSSSTLANICISKYAQANQTAANSKP